MPGAEGQLRFHVRDKYGNVIWPAITQVDGETYAEVGGPHYKTGGPYYRLDDETGGALSQEVLALNELVLWDDWYKPPYDAAELVTDTQDDGNPSVSITFRVSHELKRDIKEAAALRGLDLSAWLRGAAAEMSRASKQQEEVYPGARAAVEQLDQRLAEIQLHIDGREVCRDISLYVRIIRMNLWSVLDPKADARQIDSDLHAVWRKIAAELFRLLRNNSLEPAALPLKLNSCRPELYEICCNLCAVGL